MGDEQRPEDGPRPVLELVPSGLKPPSAQQRRLLELPPRMLMMSSFISIPCCAKPACRTATREMRFGFGHAAMAM